MTPAEIHAEAFEDPWSALEIAALVEGGATLIAEEEGFILIRAAADEAEVLTLAVRPRARRGGIGRRLVESAAVAAKTAGAQRLFLEVAADNGAAIALYRVAGFEQVGRRPNYYRRGAMRMQDALIFSRALNSG